jgi:tetratricopeptide (TPR) repeat protein
MNRKNALYSLVAFAVGATTVLVAKTTKPMVTFDPTAYYAGHDAKAASAALLAEAEKLAGDDSWQRIYVGRVAYLSGDTTKAEAMFDGVINGKVAKSDLYRIATVYAIAKNWGKAKPLFERAIAMDPEDDTGILTAGCWYNLNGERERAEELFGRAFGKAPEHSGHYSVAAGSYVGVQPF